MSPKKTEPVYFLLVDDLEENLLSLEALLRRDGLVLLKARSGPEALELLLKHDVALALLDVQMPGMDGFELAELMRGTERTRRVPIIFLTAGSADTQRRFRGYETGAVDFLHKPIESDILKSKASVFYELFRQQQQLMQQRDELEEYSQALKDADNRKDEFLAMLAHELRNPLAPIRNGLKILQMSPDAEVLDEVRGMMDRQLTHMVRLIDDLLDVSRVSQGKIELRKEYITLQSIIQTAVEGSRPFIDNANHTLTVEIPGETLWLNADLTRLAQVISNMLNNAAKYTPENGQIKLSAQKEGNDIVIKISDNGLGIPPDMLPKVFDLFTQVDRNLERSQGGLGIGLALVKQLVTMHEGIIKAESAGAGKGSTFTVRFPLSENNVQQDTAEKEPVENSKADTGLIILVVDDNIPSAKTTGWTLEILGYKPTLAHDGLEALEMAKNLRPDVILLDIGLPGMNGYDVCRELRKLPEFKDTLLIAQTGWGQEKDRQLAQEAGFDHHLVKPVDFDALSKLIADVKAN
jgi:signal transduction histidine kinase